MSQNIYRIQLLNDLHNHFPELLYNPGRFYNIQDVLYYIRTVAEINPYQQGLQQYNSQRQPRTYTTVPPTTTNQTTIPPVGGEAPQTFVTMISEDIPNTRIRMSMNNNTNNSLINTLLGGLFADIMNPSLMTGAGLQSFLDQRVPVFPTNQEITNASATFRATRVLEDICAICQDDITTNQNVRRLIYCNHYFHQDCIDTWFQGNVQCPTCRHDIREVNPINNQNQHLNQHLNQNRNQNRNNTDRNTNSMPPPVPENYRRMNIRHPENT